MNDDSFQRWLESSRQIRADIARDSHLRRVPFIAVRNDRSARELTLEDRLTLSDRQLLKDMGIRL
jgi:hypothetical protein